MAKRYARNNQPYSNSTKNNEIFSSSKKEAKPAKVYKTPAKHIIVNVLVVIVAATCIAGGGAMIYAQSLLSGIFNNNSLTSINMEVLPPSALAENTDTPNVEVTGNLIKDPMVLNIALFGSDVRPNEADIGNSDTVMLVSIDNRHQKIKLTSFMRDTWVNIPKVNYNGKLNAAYAAGGPVLAVETLERNFGIDIDRYAVVDFETFPVIIDALDGVEITINNEEAAYLDYDWPYRVPSFANGAGTYHLNGQEALDHARNRHVGMYDFERTQRQRDVMMAIVEKFRGTKDVSVLINLMVQFLPSVSTNISVDEMASLAKNSLKYLGYPLSQFRLPSDDNYSNQSNATWGSILVINKVTQAREDIARFIYEETADTIYGKTSSEVPVITNSSAVASQN